MPTLGEVVGQAMKKHRERHMTSSKPLEYLVAGNQCRIDDPGNGNWTVWQWEDGSSDEITLRSEKAASV